MSRMIDHHPTCRWPMNIARLCLMLRCDYTDCLRVLADQIRGFVPMRYTVLGRDGFGRSDTRANLRRYFEVDRYYIAQAPVDALAREGKMTGKDVARAIKLYKIDAGKENPVEV